MPDDYAALSACPMFAGIPLKEVASLLKSLGAEVHTWKQGEVIRSAGDEMKFFGVVLSGSVQAAMPQNGRMQIVGRFPAGESFAEAAPVVLKRTPVTITAMEDSRVICIDPDKLPQSNHPCAPVMQANLTAEMSKKLLHLSSKLAILGEPRLRNRILMYLDNQPTEPDGSVKLTMSYRDIADYLGVNHTALSRELGRMQDEQIIRVGKRRITVVNDPRTREE